MKILLLSIVVTFFATQQALSKGLPDDISFGVADMKYDGKQVKICEFGDGAFSAFVGYDLLCGPGEMWEKFWTYLRGFDAPIWLIDPASDHDSLAVKGIDTFRSLNGHLVSNLAQLKKNVTRGQKGALRKRWQASRYRAIIFSMWRHKMPVVSPRAILKTFPLSLCVGKFTRKQMSNKLLSNKLFNEPWMRQFRPACKVCPKKYTPMLAQSIIEELKADMFVIKPENSTLSQGVIAVMRDDLDATLRLILKKPEQLKDESIEPAYKYWAHDKNDIFLVEAYAPSKIIQAEGKSFDATLRIAFCLHYSDGKPSVTILDGFWKFPAKSLEDEGSLIDKHISNVYIGSGVRSAKVDPADMAHIRKIMPQLLKKVYTNILEMQN
ncbi:hypothetical protein JST56_00695 [Candidatus Dependentiae bacterium]|jgi:hypothetical protein|nr:hypothetical protein [Candidatus Dependentiae bacterium]